MLANFTSGSGGNSRSVESECSIVMIVFIIKEWNTKKMPFQLFRHQQPELKNDVSKIKLIFFAYTVSFSLFY